MSIEPAENKFLTFAATAPIPEQLLSDEEYAANIRRVTGFLAGEPADNALMNTVLRNLTMVMRGLTDVIAANGTEVSQTVQAEEISKGLNKVFENLIEENVIKTVTPIMEKMQKQIDSYAAAYHGVPVTGIIPISCTEEQLEQFLKDYPSFKVCDGKNGTIDLRDRFIFCASDIVKPHVSGGSKTFDKVTVEETRITTEQMPNHSHEVPGGMEGNQIDKWPFGAPASAKTYMGSQQTLGYRVNSSTTGKGKGHTHKLLDKTDNGKGYAEGMMPPYYALIFVQKVRPY